EAHRVKNTYFWGNTANGDSNQSHIVGVRDSGQTSPGYSAAHIRLNIEYFLHAPQSGQMYYPYTPYAYPHPLTGGNPSPTATPTPAPTVTPSPSATPVGDISFPATSGIITIPFVINGDSTISQSIETIVPAQGGRALYTFNVTIAGDYVMSAMVNC